MIDLRKVLTVLACCCVCLMVATSSMADFVGVVTELKTDVDTVFLCGAANGDFVPFPLTVCKVSIQFGDDNDRLAAVAFSDLQVMNGGVPDGLFNHHPLGEDTPYECALLTQFPDLICDSYVAIGEQCAGIGQTSPDGDFVTTEFNENGHVFGGWFNGRPSNGLGDAFNSINPDGRVLILQSAVPVGSSLEGPATVFWQSIDNPAVFEQRIDIVCEAQCAGDCLTDVNGDGETGPFDLAALLAAWGSAEAGNCLDANHDGDIGPFDLAALLASWGPCP